MCLLRRPGQNYRYTRCLLGPVPCSSIGHERGGHVNSVRPLTSFCGGMVSWRRLRRGGIAAALRPAASRIQRGHVVRLLQITPAAASTTPVALTPSGQEARGTWLRRTHGTDVPERSIRIPLHDVWTSALPTLGRF
jgi:hypothetical protein